MMLTLTVIFAALTATVQAQGWEDLTSGTSYILFDFSFPPGQNDVGYAAGMQYTYDANGVVIKTTDGGDNWTTLLGGSGGSNDGIEAIAFTSPDTGFIAGWNDYAAKTTDGGTTWTEISIGSGNWYFLDLEFWDSDNGVAVSSLNSGGFAIYVTDDGGDTWTSATGVSTNVQDVAYADATTLYGVGLEEKIIKSTDGGNSWSVIYSGTPTYYFIGVDFVGNFGVVGGEDGKIMSTNDGGNNWSTYQTGYHNFQGVKVFNADSAYIGGTDEDIYKTTDGGSTWTVEFNGTGSSHIYKIKFTENNTGFLCGSQGMIMRKEAPLAADFEADTTTTCAGSTVDFTDMSTGATSWSWTFEGGSPSTSTDQHPSVTYSNPGNFDVSLTVSDGAGSETETKTEYITVLETPEKADQPDGEDVTCTGQMYFYETELLDYATAYEWEVNPASAGSITWEDNLATFTADDSWTGDFTVRVRATNICGDGEWSDELECTQYISPDDFILEGGGSYCLGGDGVEITLSGSQTGIDYELFIDGETTGVIVEGTGSEISFGYQTDEGFYTATGSNDNCSMMMIGQLQVSIDFPPLEPDTPEGPTVICEEETSDYTTSDQGDADDLVWVLTPEEAGTIAGSGEEATVTWNDNFTGSAFISVYGINECGDGNPSGELEVSVGAPTPEISGEDLVCDWSEEFYSVEEHEGSTYTWTVTGGTITDGDGTYMVTVAWSGEGEGTVSVEEETTGGCTGTSEIFEVMIDDCTGTGETAGIPEVLVYPNPASDFVRFSFALDQGEQLSLDVFNAMGQQVCQAKTFATGAKQTEKINVSHLPEGMYIIHLSGTQGIIWSGKFQKTR